MHFLREHTIFILSQLYAIFISATVLYITYDLISSFRVEKNRIREFLMNV